ncbi:hypothetical protein GCM10010279_58850 [Streptomyces mutabilis]|nr:hypothetical protein GCM10010279_58850 [Streptomyces mutabilis]
MGRDQERVVRELVDAHGETYAAEAGIGLKDTPQPLYRLLVLAHLLSAPCPRLRRRGHRPRPAGGGTERPPAHGRRGVRPVRWYGPGTVMR